VNGTVTANVAFPTTQAVSGTVSIDTTKPLQVTVTNPSSGGGTTFSGQLQQGGSNVSSSNPLPVSMGANYVEVSPATATGAVWTSTARATPGAGLMVVLHFSSTAAMNAVNLQASNDGTTWTTVKTVAPTFNVANNVVVATDAVAGFYRVTMQSQAANNVMTLTTTFTSTSIDVISTTAISGAVSVAAVNSVGASAAESSTTLAANATFTSGAKVSSGGTYSTATAHVFTDQPGVLRMEFSIDNATWFRATPDLVVIGGVPAFVQVPFTQTYVRVIYINGPTAQTAFRLSTFLSKTGA
jgi:hypothetical protein